MFSTNQNLTHLFQFIHIRPMSFFLTNYNCKGPPTLCFIAYEKTNHLKCQFFIFEIYGKL